MTDEIPFSREARSVFSEADEIARRAGKVFDSAHLLLSIFTVPCEAQSILLEKRLDCDLVLDMLPAVEPEPRETVGIVYRTAAQIALNVGSRQVTSVHLLMAISRTPSCRAARVLEKAGLPMFSLRTHAMAHLTDPRLKRAALERLVAQGFADAGQVPARRQQRLPSANAGSVLVVNPARPRLDPREAPVPDPASEPDEDDEQPVEFLAVLPCPEREPTRNAAIDAEPSEPTRFGLDPERFPTLCTLGRNLTQEAEQGRLDALIGRQDALEAVVDILCKRRANNPLLLGDPGVGKTALVEGLASLIVSRGDALPALAGKVIVSVSVADLLAGTAMRGSFAARLRELKDEVLAADRRVILFIDEIHTLIGAGVGDGGMDAANDLKGALARGEFPCIGATTFVEYQRHIQSDPALSRRFEVVYLREPSLEEAERILDGVAPIYERFHAVRFSQDARRAAVRLTDRVISDRALPAKAIDVLDRAAARVRRSGRDVVLRDDVVSVLAGLVDLPMDFLALSPSERLRGLEVFLGERVFGHETATAAIGRSLAQNWVRFGSRRPLGSFVLVGPPGTGRGTLAAALAEYLFGSRQALLEIDGADYAESHSLSHLLGSPPGYVGHEQGGLLADMLNRRPFLVVVWRDLDRAHSAIQGLVAQILSEGNVTDRRGRRMDFRNSVHILTVNLEEDETTGRAVGFTASKGEPRPTDSMVARCRKRLPADLVSCVDAILALPRLSDSALERIACRAISLGAASFHEEHGISLIVDPALAPAIACRCRNTARPGAAVYAMVSEVLMGPASAAVYAMEVPPDGCLRAVLRDADCPTLEMTFTRE